jgi:hypothetical protein
VLGQTVIAQTWSATFKVYFGIRFLFLLENARTDSTTTTATTTRIITSVAVPGNLVEPVGVGVGCVDVEVVASDAGGVPVGVGVGDGVCVGGKLGSGEKVRTGVGVGLVKVGEGV